MQATKIEWVINPDGTQGYTFNPITGCLNNCSYCYGKRIAKRFGDDYMPKYHPDRYIEAEKLKKPSTIFVGSMGDMFGDWVNPEQFNNIAFPKRHIYLFLTKNPSGYKRISLPATNNNWRGITIDSINKNVGTMSYNDINNREKAGEFYRYVKDNKIKSFVSLEPLLKFDLENYNFDTAINELFDITDWIIIGALTINGKPQKTVNFKQVIDELKPYHHKMFVKDSVYKLFSDIPRLRAIPYNEKRDRG